MAMYATKPDVTPDSLRSAIEARDAETLSALYADNAVITIMDRDHPPGAPMLVSGRAAINEYCADICSRNMTHAVETAVADESHLAFIERCAYPDGTRVVCSAILDTAGGRIQRQVALQVWDDAS
jgi:hypothetical protein